jgi:hypothetical protein
MGILRSQGAWVAMGMSIKKPKWFKASIAFFVLWSSRLIRMHSKDTYLKKLYKLVSGDADEEHKETKTRIQWRPKLTILIKSLRRDFPELYVNDRLDPYTLCLALLQIVQNLVKAIDRVV